MGWLGYGAIPMLLMIFALVHFVRNRSGNYFWLFIIIFLGPIGAIVYILVEVLPEWRSSGAVGGHFAKRKRLRELEAAVRDNPSTGNFEELADLYREEGDCGRARAAYDRAIGPRTDFPDPFFGRALCALAMNDIPAAIADLEKVLTFDRKHDYFRAMGLLAHCYAVRRENARAEALFREALQTSTLSETQYNFAEFLASTGRIDEARETAERILNKRASLSGPLRRAQEPWFARAAALLKQLESRRAAR
jgi:hypothetical protein